MMLNVVMRKELADPKHADNVLELFDVKIAWVQKLNKKIEIITYKKSENDDMKGDFDFKQVVDFETELTDLQERLLFPYGRPIMYIGPKGQE